ncbi:hypothetical protein NQ314_015511 [Rhamnusium bicolor]|uniref:Uncharacterized protein n=1 Tax=Rhamnusium bicolor TaxID=1586634 RepID=A0AAV8WYJ8_9CUCU|nr:hypothetical protein NQ314_015511 [Rhamnusium bicolor]
MLLGEKYSGLKPRGTLQNYDQLKKNCLMNGKLFEDPQFPIDNIIMGKNWESMRNTIQWLRPKVFI